MRRFLFLCVIASLALAACEGSRNNTSWSKTEEGHEVVPPLKKAEKAEHADTSATDSSPANTSQAVH